LLIAERGGFNILFYEMSKFDAVQLSDFFGTGVNGSRVKINNNLGEFFQQVSDFC